MLPGASLAVFTPPSPYPRNVLTSQGEESSFLWLFTPTASRPQAPAMEMLPVEEITLQLAKIPSRGEHPTHQGCKGRQSEAGTGLWGEAFPGSATSTWGPMQLQLHESVLVSLPSPTSLVFTSWRWWCSSRHDMRPELLRGSSSSHSNHLGQEENPILRPHGTIFSEEEYLGSVYVHFSIEA